MKPANILSILATNRELIQQNNRHCLETLSIMDTLYRPTLNEECILSIELNYSMVKFYFHSQYHDAISNSENILGQFPKSIYFKMISWHLWLIGHCYASSGNFLKAEEYLLRAKDTVDNIKEDVLVLKHEIFHSFAMNNHLGNGKPDVTLDYLSRALDIISKTNDKIRQANCLMGMGNVFLELKKYSEAKSKYHTAAHIYEEKLDWQNMACVYSNLGLTYLQLQNYDASETHLMRAIELQLRSSAPEHMCNTYFNLALLSKEKAERENALGYLISAKNIATKTRNEPALKEIYRLETDLK